MNEIEWTERWNRSMLNNYGTPPLMLVSGHGARVTDESGRTYLDFLAGIAVNALGHAHPAVVEAVGRQAASLGHTSNLAAHPVGLELAERLIELTGREGRVFFCNSGAEANEAAFKITRLTGRTRVLAALGSFHGRTMGALTLTGQPAKRAAFEPLVPDVDYVQFNDSEAARTALAEAETAAIVLEPVQGEGGVIPAEPGYLADVQSACRDSGALLVLDEVQTGIGRTGQWFAHQIDQVEPDVMTLAKGLGGGLPIGAMIAFGSTADLLTPGTHGSTFGGNPVSCAASLAVIDEISRADLMSNAFDRGADVQRFMSSAPGVSSVRGRGLLLAIVVDAGIVASEVERHARELGLLVNAVAPDAIRLAPPLNISATEVTEACEILTGAISRASS